MKDTFEFISASLPSLNLMLILGLTLFGGAYGGRLFQRIKIPQVVGYIAIGIALGQTGLRVIGPELSEMLQPFSTFALAIIGFMVGGELKIETLKRNGKQFAYILLFEALVAFIIVAILTAAACWLIFRNAPLSIALGLLLGSIASATAPAATTDVLWENKSRGPLTSMVLGIVAMDDAVALLLFAAATSIAGALLGQKTAGFIAGVLSFLYELGVAVAIGLLAGLVLKRVTARFVDEARVLAFSMGSLLLVVGFSQALGADMILASMTMGFFVANFSKRKSAETFRVVDSFAPPVYVLFFVLVGAKLDIRHITLVTAIIAGVYVLGRTAGKFLGSWIGAVLSSAPMRVRRYLPFCLFSQAGVAIGLSIVAGQTFPGTVGDTVLATVAATTFIVQIIGPPSVKYAITRAEEVGMDITEDDLLANAKASELIDLDAPSIRETAHLKEVLATFSTHDSMYYPVVDDAGKLQGVVTVDSIKSSFAVADIGDMLLAWDIMEEPGETCGPDDDATKARRELLAGSLEYLPVVAPDGSSLGLVDRLGIRRFMARRMQEYNSKIVELNAPA